MEMKKMLLLTLPLMVMCAVSCEKDKGNDGNTVQKLVKEISWIEDDYQEQFMFEYDENARVINVTEIVDGNAEGQYSISYNGSTITEKYLFRNYETGEWKEDGITCYYLNNDGYLIKSESIKNGEVTMYTMYEYAGNQLKSVANYDADGTKWNPSFEYEWQNDDIRYEYQSGGSPYPNKYEYTDAENKLNISFCNPVIVSEYSYLKFKGTGSRHLTSGYGNDSQWNNRAYEFDSAGYPTKIRDINEYRTTEYNIKYY